jgi:hypothetical protein
VFQVETNGQWADGGPYVVGTNTVDGAINLGAAGKTELRWTVLGVVHLFRRSARSK